MANVSAVAAVPTAVDVLRLRVSNVSVVPAVVGVPAVAGVPAVDNNPFATGISTLSVIPAVDLSLLWLESLLLLPSYSSYWSFQRS
jgi:hypothetical protein